MSAHLYQHGHGVCAGFQIAILMQACDDIAIFSNIWLIC